MVNVEKASRFALSIPSANLFVTDLSSQSPALSFSIACATRARASHIALIALACAFEASSNPSSRDFPQADSSSRSNSRTSSVKKASAEGCNFAAVDLRIALKMSIELAGESILHDRAAELKEAMRESQPDCVEYKVRSDEVGSRF